MDGLYFHIPFCKSKCPYCDFYSVRYDGASAQAFEKRAVEEIKKYGGEFDTIYFGGGTPSAVEPELIGRLIEESKRQFTVSPEAEITVECNPSPDLERAFERYASFGVNRISLGMQSARDSERFALGRRAGRAEVERAVNGARRAGIDNISLDIMLGIPNQSVRSLDETFEFIRKMQVNHISAYMLKIEEGTKFYEMQSRLALPEEDEVCEMYLKTVDVMKKAGLEQYEISNFARPGFESRHNLKYWTLEDYLGIGPSAHSLWRGRRFYYDRNFNKTDDGPGGDSRERIMLGLRLTQGVDRSLIKKDYSKFLKMGLIRENGSKISLTRQGMLVSNIIIGELM